MIVHSDAVGSMVFFLVMVGLGPDAGCGAHVLGGREFRLAGKILGWWSVLCLAYTALTIAVSLLLPQKVVNPGQSYCVDSWCIGVQNVTKTPLGQNVAYKADVRIFSDLNSGTTSAKGASLYLVDERGRRFPLIPDPSAIPFDIAAESSPVRGHLADLPSRRRCAAAFPKGDGPNLWITKFFIGDDSAWLHRPTLIRVL